MRNRIALPVVVLVSLAVAVPETRAQCPTVTAVSPRIIGRTINPASTYFNFNGDVADGETITIDSTGANLVFEFDTNGTVTAGRIPVAIPAPPGNRDAARDAFRDAVNSIPSAPCEASCVYAPQFPEYFTLVWKGEGGYGAVNTDTGSTIIARNFVHAGEARSYILLTGTGLDTATGVRLEQGTTVLNGTWEYTPAGGLTRGFRVAVVPDGANPSVSVPPLGDYDLVVTKTGCPDLRISGAVEVVDNLLDDSTFSMHFLGNTNHNGCGAYGSYDVWPGPLWRNNGVQGQPIGSFDYREKASAYSVNCQRQDPWPVQDYIWGSLTSDRAGLHQVWQEIPVNFTVPTTVTLTGMYAGGTSALMNYGARLYDQNETLIAEDANSDANWIDNTPPNAHWANFSLSGTFPAGTTRIKVVFYLEILTDWQGAAVHIDDLLLFVGQPCPNPPAISSISPDYGVRGTQQTVTITGANFASDSTTVRLFQGSTELLPVPGSVSVITPTQLTATFDLTGAPRDYWGVAVQNTGCAVETLSDAFDVVLAGPALSNGSFELPAVPANACYADTDVGGPIDDWTSIHIHPYGGGSHFRDALYTTKFMPTCPSPDGDHWASVQAPDDSYGGMRRLTQTVTVTAGTTYSLSGYFAAGGPNNLSLSLLDGGYLDSAIAGATATVLPGPGDYDWTFGYVMGTPTGNLVTAVWDTDNDAEGKKIAHADALVLTPCTAPVSVTSVNPTIAASGGAVEGIAITGSGFGSGSPAVYLVRPGFTAAAGSVTVLDDGHLLCDFDLTRGGMGYVDVIVGNNGCFATLDDGLFIAPGMLMNGEFEEPLANQVCDPRTPVAGLPTHWQVSNLAKFRRDGDVFYPTCPSPNTAGGHYATMSTSEGDDLRTWQTIRVTPGRSYRFGGWFAGGGNNTVSIKLVDGADPAGTVLASETVMVATGQQYDWMPATVQGRSIGDLMTVVWEMTGTAGPCASHADGLFVDTPCHDPFADVDEDGDVDQADFAVFQACYTGPEAGPIPSEPAYCACLNIEGPLGEPDSDVDQGDLVRFEDCASGPGIPANKTCDND